MKLYNLGAYRRSCGCRKRPSTQSRNYGFPIATSLLLLALPCITASSASGVSSAVSKQLQEAGERMGLRGIRPDPFVAASPLIVAAVCSDGICMVASHTAASQEQLLRDSRHIFAQNDDDIAGTEEIKEYDSVLHEGTIERPTTWSKNWKDLQQNHGGPFRIQGIDRYGTHLLTAGWRADCSRLVEKVRSLASKDVAVFGQPNSLFGYGKYLAEQSTWWMANCAVSSRIRSLSCVGLLITSERSDEESIQKHAGFLWFMDLAGAYRVRALAIGGGKVDVSNNQNEPRMVSHAVNLELEHYDFATMSTREGLQTILCILCGNTTTSRETTNQALLSEHCEVEMAIVSYTNQESKSRAIVKRVRIAEMLERKM